MNAPSAPPARLSPGQTVGWGLVAIIFAALIVAFFVYGRLVRPLLGL